MRSSLRGLALLGFLLAQSCAEQKISEQKRDEEILGPRSGADVVPQPAPLPQPGQKPVESKTPYQLYPPVYGVFPTAFPTPGSPFYFGYSPNSPEAYQSVFVYIVAAVPDFEKAESAPEFESQFEAEQFMDAWAKEFAKSPENIKKLDELAASFRWQVDPELVNDLPVEIPAVLLAGEADYMKLTQRTLARRFQWKSSGTTSIEGVHNGQRIEIPLVINSYEEAERIAGAARYQDPSTGCVSCHSFGGPFGRTPVLKHSSDYLSFFSDAELIDIIKNSRYPSGDLVLGGDHMFPLADAAEERALLAHLRNLPSYYDRILELLKDATGINLRAVFPGWL